MLWLFLLLGLVGSPFAMLFGHPFAECMTLAVGAYVLSMAVGGFAVLIRTRRLIFPLIDLSVFVLVVGLGYGLFGETPHQYLLFTVAVLLYTSITALAFHFYCRHYRLGYAEMLKIEARYAAEWIQKTDGLA